MNWIKVANASAREVWVNLAHVAAVERTGRQHPGEGGVHSVDVLKIYLSGVQSGSDPCVVYCEGRETLRVRALLDTLVCERVNAA